VTFKH